MKKLLYTLAGLSALALFASCNKEAERAASPEGEVVTATFTVAAPEGVATKAISDGTTATNLIVAVYDEQGKYLKQLSESATPNRVGLTWNVSMKVIKDMTYQFVFLAKKEAAVDNGFCHFDAANAKISIDYSAVPANSDAADFFFVQDKFKVENSFSKTEEMHRPLAQVNFGASDLTEAGYSINTATMATGITLTGIYSEMDVLTEAATGDAGEVTFEKAARVSETPQFVTNYDRVAMVYALVAKENQQANVTATLNVTAKSANAANTQDYPITRTVVNVPLKRNYRTNILGNIFTNDFNFTVNTVPGFYTSDSNKIIGPSFASVADLNAYFATFTDNADNGDVNPEVVTLTDFGASETSTATITLPKYKATPVRIRITAAYSGTLTLAYADADADKPATVELYAPNMSGATLTGTITSTHLTILEGSHIGTSTVSTSDTTLEIRPTATVGTVKIVKGNANIQGNVANVEVLSSATAVAGTPVQVFVSKEAAIETITLNAKTDVVVEQPKDQITKDETERKVAVYVKEGAGNSTAKAQNGGVIYVKAEVPCTVTADGTSEAEDGTPVSSTVIIELSAAGSSVNATNGGAIDLTANGNCEVTASGSSTPEDPTETPVPSSVVIDKVASGADVHTETEGDATVEPAPDADIYGDIIAYVAKIGEAKYLTIEEAVAAVNDDETIIVLTDITQDNGILFDKENISAKLDLNSKTITINSGSNVNYRAFRIDNGALEVYGGSIIAVGAGTNSSNGTGCYGAFRIEANGALNAHDLTLKNSRPWGLNVKVLGGTAILTNVNITSSYGGGIEVTEADLGAQSKKGTAVLTNCHFTQTGYFDHCSSTLSVSGGSSLTINSGSYESENYALYVFSSGGEITVNDGTFSGNKDGVAIVAAIDLNTYPSYTGGLKLKDGVYQGGYAITSPAYMEVSGGKYSVDPTAFLAAGLEANLDGDGWWVVGPAVWSGAVASDEQFNASVDATAKTVTVSSTAVLAKLAANVQAGNDYAGYKITLTKDMDLNNQEWTPIGGKGKNFAGEFDGGGHTISNLKITRGYADVDLNWRVGFIGSAIGAKVHDFTIHNANVTARGEVAAAVGYNAYSVEGKPSEIYNVNVTGHVVVSAAYRGAAAICGYSNYYVHECTVNVDDSSIIDGFWASGGIVGFSPQSGDIKNNYSNIKVVSDYACGGIVGLIEDSVEISGNTVESTSLQASANYGIGGLIGMMNYGTGLKIKNNTVSNVTIDATENVAGVIGSVREDRDGGTGAVEITNNTIIGITINSSKGDGTAAFIGFMDPAQTATISGNSIQGTINTAKALVNDGIWAGVTDASNVVASNNTMNLEINVAE
jgi:hypothetical protein